MRTQLSKNHACIKLTEKVQTFCQPFFDKTEISYFIHARFYDSGRCFFLSTNSVWEMHFWQKESPKKMFETLMPGVSFWHTNPFLKAPLKEASALFGLDYRMDIIERGKDYFDVFGFASTPGNIKILDYYMNYMSVLKYFIFYFKERADELIKACEYAQDQQFTVTQTPKRWQDLHIEPSVYDILGQVAEHTLNTPEGEVTLSRADLRCLFMSLREGVSHKTTDCIAKVRKKLHCTSNIELFDKAWDFGIVHMAKAAS